MAGLVSVEAEVAASVVSFVTSVVVDSAGVEPRPRRRMVVSPDIALGR
ncbi:unnamed protein product [Chondrus crispus]|uniref:Uncharacterized protein n=1 Tax=Chondrus crispus TaxID=2769 RepID=R7QMV6_CHOCR|nr:unnamed protein product [Chondrus crispus]CDF38816.1 unnamed protein product [Chondrus crispus]|eukprot:XP_005718721.1 unnamed protein product [Chondrus crispus]